MQYSQRFEEIIENYKNILQFSQNIEYQLTIFLQSIIEEAVESNAIERHTQKYKSEIGININILYQLNEAVIFNLYWNNSKQAILVNNIHQCPKLECSIEYQNINVGSIILEIQYLKSNFQSLQNIYLQSDQQPNDTHTFGTHDPSRSLHYQYRIFDTGETQLGAFRNGLMSGLCIISGIGGSLLAEFCDNICDGFWQHQCDNGDTGTQIVNSTEMSLKYIVEYKNGDVFKGRRRLKQNNQAVDVEKVLWNAELLESEKTVDGQLIRRDGQVIEGVWANDAMQYPVLQCPILDETMEKQVQWTIEQVSQSVSETKQIVDKIQSLFKGAEKAIAELNPLIKQLYQDYQLQCLDTEESIFQDICKQIIYDFVHQDKNISQISNTILQLCNAFAKYINSSENKRYEEQTTATYGMPYSVSMAKYQMRVFPNGERLVGMFTQFGQNGLGTKTDYCESWLCEFRNGSANGVGKYAYHDDTYVGEFKDNTIHGKGKFIRKKEDQNVELWSYEGDWRENYRTGRGRIQKPNGVMYEGDFWRDSFQGKGQFQTNEFTYIGNFYDSEYHGMGKYQSIGGDTLEGEWVNNLFVGSGHYKVYSWDLDEWAEYDGCWERRGQIVEGFGTIMFSRGEIYKGMMKSGPNLRINSTRFKTIFGRGRLTAPNEYSYEGKFESGCFEGFGRLECADGMVYEGEFRRDRPCGRGRLVNEKGDVFEGEWKYEECNFIVGTGTITYENGDVYKGQWGGKHNRVSIQQNKFRHIRQGKLIKKSGEQINKWWHYDEEE